MSVSSYVQKTTVATLFTVPDSAQHLVYLVLILAIEMEVL